MKKYLLLVVICFAMLPVIKSQPGPAYAFRVKFKDKNGTLSFADSLQILSPKALQRRHHHLIGLDSTDLPIVQHYIDTVMIVGNALRLQAKSKWFNQIVIVNKDSAKSADIAALPMVESVQLVARWANGVFKTEDPYSKSKFPEPTPLSQKTSGTSAFYGLSFQQIDQIEADCLHDIGYMGEEMDIAVFDANFRYTNTCGAFDSIRTNGKIKYTYNIARDTSFVYATNINTSHGMNVLGCMAAYLPGTYVGSAPLANYFLYITEDMLVEQPVEEDNWLHAAEHADSSGVYLINSSLGYNNYPNPFTSYTYAQMNGTTSLIARAANMAVAKGIFVVNAQGNEGLNAWHYMLTPADGDSVFSVGSVDGSGAWGYSGYGPTVDGQVKPDGMAMGRGTSLIGDNCTVGAANGSSFASPIMCGAIACLWQALPHLKNWQIRNLVTMSSDRYANPNNTHGYGIPNFCIAYNIALGTSDIHHMDYQLAVFPNPVKQDFVIRSFRTGAEAFQMSIYDITGAVVAKQPLAYGSEWTIDALKTVPPGQYILVLSNATRTFSTKIMKQ